MSIKLNDNYNNVKKSYLFSEIGRRVRTYREAHPDSNVISLGIGDVTLPLTPTVIAALHSATDEMSKKETFRGYAPEYGYDFARDAIVSHYAEYGVTLSPDEIFVSDGAKSDLGNIVEIFGDNEVLIPDPVYPVNYDSNVMSGRRISFINATKENNFLPMPDELPRRSMIIYMCSPNNPTGAVYSKEQFKKWVSFARETESVIIFDSAYEAYISGNYPHSIYEVDGAKSCAIEICSLSKTAGFTGVRFAWTVMPSELIINGVQLAQMWARRQATKFNGVSYIIQRAAAAALSPEGMAECRELVSYYMKNASILSSVLKEKGIWYTGGVSSPYLWLKCPDGYDSWSFFDYLLNNAEVVGTPGSGFGAQGEGYFRLTSFGSREATEEAASRLRRVL